MTDAETTWRVEVDRVQRAKRASSLSRLDQITDRLPASLLLPQERLGSFGHERLPLNASGLLFNENLNPALPMESCAWMNQLPHKRRYIVSGIDGDGDVQAFASDDHGAANEVREQMEEDLTDVRMIETADQEVANGD